MLYFVVLYQGNSTSDTVRNCLHFQPFDAASTSHFITALFSSLRPFVSVFLRKKLRESDVLLFYSFTLSYHMCYSCVVYLSPVKRGDIGFSFSVCPSVRLSVCPSVRLSVRPSVRLSGFVSRPYLRKYSVEFFKISHTDRTSMEGVQRRMFVRFDEKM